MRRNGIFQQLADASARGAARLLATSLLLLGVHAAGWAAYPERPITLVVPYATGSGGDITGRLLAKKLGEILGVQVIVDNKPGAATMIGAQYVAKAKPDGYTVLMATTAMSVFSLRKEGTPVDARKDLTFVSSFA